MFPTDSAPAAALTPHEIALYDRQIRLWGQDVQLRLRATKVLVINLGALATEIVKNLVLGGIHSLEILDASTVREEDFATQFLLPADAQAAQLKLPLVREGIRKLNPRVNLSICTDTLESKGPEYWRRFDLVVATELTRAQFLKLNDATRALRLPLYVTGLHGLFAYVLADLIEHRSTKDHEFGNQPREAGTAINAVKKIVHVDPKPVDLKETVTIVDTYVPLRDMFSSKKLRQQLRQRQLNKLSGALPLIFALFDIPRPADSEALVDVDLLKKRLIEVCTALDLPPDIVSPEYTELFSRNAYAEFAPSAAIVGGMVAQDVIQYLGGKDSPINNCMIFDGHRFGVPIYYL